MICLSNLSDLIALVCIEKILDFRLKLSMFFMALQNMLAPGTCLLCLIYNQALRIIAYLLNTYFSFFVDWVLILNLRWIVNNVCLYLHLLVSQTLFLEDLAWVIYFYSNSSSAGGHDMNLRLQVQLYYELMACMHITLYTVFDYLKKKQKKIQK